MVSCCSCRPQWPLVLTVLLPPGTVSTRGKEGVFAGQTTFPRKFQKMVDSRIVANMAGSNPWREDRIDVLLAALSEVGMSMSRSAAGELIDERVQFVATQMRVTPRTARTYLIDEAVQALATTMAFGLVEEAPGADVLEAPRTSTIPVQLVGMAMAGLGKALRIRLMESDDLDHVRESIAQLAHAQGTLGLVVATQDTVVVDGVACLRTPGALLHRVARCLETAADLSEDGVVGHGVSVEQSQSLPSALRRDALRIREAVTST